MNSDIQQPQAPLSRVIALVDLDAFYAMVAESTDPSLKGKPVAVTQYNSFRGGSIIAVNYHARKFGIKRGSRGDDAKKLCPELNLFAVPEEHGKANLTIFRNKSTEIFKLVIENLGTQGVLEKASIDEMFMDVTVSANEKVAHMHTISDERIITDELSQIDDQTAVVGCDGLPAAQQWMSQAWKEKRHADMQIIAAALIIGKIRRTVYEQSGCSCSGGIASNKMIAKLVAGFNKPNKTTLVPQSEVLALVCRTNISDVRQLGGKFGEKVIADFKVKTFGELSHVTREEFIKRYEDKGAWFFNMCQGLCFEEVKERTIVDSIGCSKNFRGPTTLTTWELFRHWLLEMNAEIYTRINSDMEMNGRVPTQLTLSCSTMTSENKYDATPFSRTTPMAISRKTTVQDLTNECESLFLRRFPTTVCEGKFAPAIRGITNIGICANKFVSLDEANAQTKLTTVNKSEHHSQLCPRCQQQVLVADVVSHNDYHAAWDLSRQLAQEDKHQLSKRSSYTYDTPPKDTLTGTTASTNANTQNNGNTGWSAWAAKGATTATTAPATQGRRVVAMGTRALSDSTVQKRAKRTKVVEKGQGPKGRKGQALLTAMFQTKPKS